MDRIMVQPAAVSTLRTSEHRGGPTGRMLIASGLLALLIGAAFAVLLSSVADLLRIELPIQDRPSS
jgi:hypothetical protein